MMVQTGLWCLGSSISGLACLFFFLRGAGQTGVVGPSAESLAGPGFQGAGCRGLCVGCVCVCACEICLGTGLTV